MRGTFVAAQYIEIKLILQYGLIKWLWSACI